MAAEHTERLPVVAEAEAALRGLGVRRPALNLRSVGRGHWFADWTGALAGSDVYIAVTGKGTGPRKVRLILDDWIFDDVAVGKLGGLLTEVFSGRGNISRGRSLLVVPVQVLRVGVGHSRYTATRKISQVGEMSAWERALAAESSG